MAQGRPHPGQIIIRHDYNRLRHLQGAVMRTGTGCYLSCLFIYLNPWKDGFDMAMIFKAIDLAIYEKNEWDRLTADQRTKILADMTVYVVPDGTQQAMDADTYPLSDMGNACLLYTSLNFYVLFCDKD